jgi:hypothetical protein
MMRARLIHRSNQPAVSHRWLPAALFAALVIVGLLGMHTFSGPSVVRDRARNPRTFTDSTLKDTLL